MIDCNKSHLFSSKNRAYIIIIKKPTICFTNVSKKEETHRMEIQLCPNYSLWVVHLFLLSVEVFLF